MKRIFFAVIVASTVTSGTARAQTTGEPAADAPPLAVRITSPLGRTGLVGKVRIVAQVHLPEDGGTREHPVRVRFLVDGAEVGVVESGPPYAVEWEDENPFERREIVAEAADAMGHAARHAIVLPPFEIVERTGVSSVLLEAGVYDASGRSVSSLEPSAFNLFENGQPQTIDLVTGETLPSTVVLLVDNSQSMGQRMAAVRKAAEHFARRLRKGDRVIVAPFNHKVGAITGPTEDVATVTEAIEAMRAGGGTAILDAVAEGTRLLDAVEGRRVIVLITDGFDENSTMDVPTAIQRSSAAQVTLYAVAVGGVTGVSLNGESTLRQLAARTGGRVFFPWRDADLAAVVASVAVDTHNRYVISYTPTNQKKDGTWREIVLQVPEGYHARTRAGYQAASPPPIRPTIEFSVTDTARALVEVAAEDIEVYEDGVPQAVDAFQEAVDPVSIVMTLDASGSMVKSADAVRQTAREFVAAVRPEDSLAVMMFADEPLLSHVLERNRHYSMTAIDKYTPAGGTALYDALWNSLMHVKAAPGRRAVVVLTDGKDENNPGTAPGSVHTLSEVLDLAQQVGAAIFAVGLGKNVEEDTLQRLAKASGGAAYFSADLAELSAQFRRVVENLRQRYVLSYTSTNSEQNGAWRKVEVRPRKTGLVVATAGGYFAPEE